MVASVSISRAPQEPPTARSLCSSVLSRTTKSGHCATTASIELLKRKGRGFDFDFQLLLCRRRMSASASTVRLHSRYTEHREGQFAEALLCRKVSGMPSIHQAPQGRGVLL